MRQSRDHRNLNGGHDLSSADTERGEAQDAIAFGLDEGLQKARVSETE
jgi:hypothetical protein